MPDLERIPPEEAAQIDDVVRLTIQQLRRRYPDETLVLSTTARKYPEKQP